VHLFVSNQQFSRAIEPCVYDFDDPTPCGMAPLLPVFLAARAHVWNISAPANGLSGRRPVEGGIGTQVLFGVRTAARAAAHDRIEHELRYVMTIGPGHDDRQRDATSVDQQHSLAPIFSPDPWGLARQILAPEGLSPEPRRRFASAKRCPPCRRTRQAPLATRRGRSPRSPIPGIACGSHWRCRSVLWATPSTGSPCVAHTQLLRTRYVPAWVCAHRRGCVEISSCLCESAAPVPAARPAARTHPILPKRLTWPLAIAFSVARTRASTGKQCSILITDKLKAARLTFRGSRDAFPGNFRRRQC